MHLKSITIKNYRSIREARKIQIERATTTVLVGPNNEGKSNILRAINLGISTLVASNRLLGKTVGDERVVKQVLSGLLPVPWTGT